ncbi:MAG: TolC family protein [Candidatus Eisenbacteria bacterium]|uniref:TolC family protein n=1 Tax=Eiseniibacteriota bacterium TaxID=2212470 RepID=A0A849SBR1_UNCEI|nr:TolC family protein [Candidatus Eisenbacteria bacterium]
MKRSAFLFTLCLLAIARPHPARAADGAPAGVVVPVVLSLSDALQLALTSNPRLQALGWEVRIAEGRALQAGARPNPVISAELENAGGTEPGLSNSETTLSIGQLLELGGKRSARLGVARADQSVLALDVRGERFALMGEVTRRYIESLAVDQSLALTEEEVRSAEEASSTTAQRVTAGAAHPVERRRADVELTNLKLDRTILQSDALLARSRLSLLWGEPQPRFERLSGTLGSLPALPNLDSLSLRAESSPVLARWRAEQAARQMRLELERSRRIPDLTAQAGIRQLSESDGHTFVAGISLPVPLFDRNRGAIEQASAALSQAPSAEAQARLDVRQSLAEGHASLRRSAVKLETLRRDVLPEAQRAYEEMRVGFERGRFAYLDLLDARRTWLRAKREELQTLLVAHLAVADLERLLGGPLDANSNPERGLDR